MSHEYTDEQIETLVRLIKEGKVIVMKKPPHMCLNCKTKTVTIFRVLPEGGAATMESECEVCHEKTYS